MNAVATDEEAAIRNLLPTDFVPSSAQARSFKTIIEEQDKEINALDTQISSLEDRIEGLRTLRQSLVDARAVRNAMLAPIRRLPPETLGEIFIWCNIMETLEPEQFITPGCPPLLLLHVCRRWRRVALGTPQLWTKITLKWNLQVDPLIAIPMWLNYSGSLPIEIDIAPEAWFLRPRRNRMWTSSQYVTSPTPSTSQAAAEEATKHITRNMDRCITFHCTASICLERLFPRGTSTSAPLLRSFKVTSEDIISLSDLGGIIAPNLAEIDISCAFASLRWISFNKDVLRTLRWNSDNLDSHDPGALDYLAEIMASCTKLEVCEFEFPYLGKDTPFAGHSFTAPHLRLLSLTWYSDLDPCLFLEACKVPRLESLRLMQRPDEDYEDHANHWPHLVHALHSLFSSSSSLKILDIDNVHLGPGGLLSILGTVTMLETLHITLPTLDDALLVELTPEPNDSRSWLCPRLTSLHLRRVDVHGDLLIRMIKNRFVDFPALQREHKDIQRLTLVSLYSCRGLSRDNQDTLQELLRSHDGLCIEGFGSAPPSFIVRNDSLSIISERTEESDRDGLTFSSNSHPSNTDG